MEGVQLSQARFLGSPRAWLPLPWARVAKGVLSARQQRFGGILGGRGAPGGLPHDLSPTSLGLPSPPRGLLSPEVLLGSYPSCPFLPGPLGPDSHPSLV